MVLWIKIEAIDNNIYQHYKVKAMQKSHFANFMY